MKENEKTTLARFGNAKKMPSTIVDVIKKICNNDCSNKVKSNNSLEATKEVKPNPLTQLEKKSTYTLESIFPNIEIQNIVLDEIDRLNKIDLCKRLGITYDDIRDVTWDMIINAINEQQNNKEKIKIKEKVIGVFKNGK